MLHVGQTHTHVPATESARSTKPCQQKAHTDRDNSGDELIAYSESDEAMSDRDSLESGEDISGSDSSDSVIITCTCGAEGRAHKRDCPLSSRNRMSGRTLFPAPSEPENTGCSQKIRDRNCLSSPGD